MACQDPAQGQDGTPNRRGSDHPDQPLTGRSADKRQAILAGALTVFARDGYSRASIDDIAAEAGVSTRTIYRHAHDKARLFGLVIEMSASRVARSQVEVIDHVLRDANDLEGALIVLGQEMNAPLVDYPEHFALVRQINAELGHVPPASLDAWQAAGPGRVRGALADQFRSLADREQLRLDDAGRAAIHFLRLISIEPRLPDGSIPDDHEVREAVTAGVRVFLHGYGERAPDRNPPR